VGESRLKSLLVEQLLTGQAVGPVSSSRFDRSFRFVSLRFRMHAPMHNASRIQQQRLKSIQQLSYYYFIR